MVTLDGMMEYGYGDDASFQAKVAARCLNAAMEYLVNAGIRQRESELYEQAVYMLAMHWYDNRDVDVIGQVRGEISHGIQSIIHQLSYAAAETVEDPRGYVPVRVAAAEG